MTPHQRVDEISNPIAIRGTHIEHGLDFSAIHEAHRRSRRRKDEVRKEGAGEVAPLRNGPLPLLPPPALGS